MDCPNCHQLIESGAAFCGNCGQSLFAANSLRQFTQPSVSIPDYALATPLAHAGELRTTMAVLCGVIGLIGAFFAPLSGLALGMTGLVLGTMGYRLRKVLSLVAIIASTVAIMLSLAVWAYVIQHSAALKKSPQVATSNTPTAAAANVSTPCYSFNFVNQLNVSTAKGSCNLNAFNGSTMGTSTDAYKVLANQIPIVTNSNFTAFAKQALEKDVHTSLPSFGIDGEQVTRFAGSPAYVISTSDSAQGIAVVEAAVLHPESSGQNIFVMVHAVGGTKADLNTLEAEWQWAQ